MSTVIDFGEFKLTRLREHRYDFEKKVCAHHHLETDDVGQIVKCRDCGERVEPYWALTRMAESLNRMHESIKSQRKVFAEEQEKGLRLKAAQELERAWRKKDLVPTCPHCSKAILPPDGMGASQVSRTLTGAGRAALPLQFRPNLALVTEDEA